MGCWWGTGWGFRVCAPFEPFENGTFSLTSLPAVVATTLKNANASLVYSFLYKMVEVGWGLPLVGWPVGPPVLAISFMIHFSKKLCLNSLGVP